MWRGTLLALTGLITGCHPAGVPAGPRTSSPQAEALAGRRAAPLLERQFGGRLADPAIEARMARVGQRLAPVLPAGGCQWRLTLLGSEEVNAFSLPGGLIYLTRGLTQRIGQDDELLAAAIAHEMSHILHGDSLKSAWADPEESFRREAEADAGAVALLRLARYSPDGLTRLMELTADIQAPGWAGLRKNLLSTSSQARRSDR